MDDKKSSIVAIDLAVDGSWSRALILNEMRYGYNHSGLPLTFVDDSEEVWHLRFNNVQAFSITSEECAPKIADLPADNIFFEDCESEWLKYLQTTSAHFLANIRHFILLCYDEVVEVICWDYTLSKANHDQAEATS